MRTLPLQILRPCCVSWLSIPRMLQARHTGARLLTCPTTECPPDTRAWTLRACRAQALRVRVAVPGHSGPDASRAQDDIAQGFGSLRSRVTLLTQRFSNLHC